VKIHLAAEPYDPYEPVSVCGAMAVLGGLQVTTDFGKVTCGRCLDSREKESASASMDRR
jgi:hypothetical protein